MPWGDRSIPAPRRRLIKPWRRATLASRLLRSYCAAMSIMLWRYSPFTPPSWIAPLPLATLLDELAIARAIAVDAALGVAA